MEFVFCLNPKYEDHLPSSAVNWNQHTYQARAVGLGLRSATVSVQPHVTPHEICGGHCDVRDYSLSLPLLWLPLAIDIPACGPSLSSAL
jgi:hypothetical protein